MTRDMWFIVLMCCAIPAGAIIFNTMIFISVAWAPVLWNAIVKYPGLDRDRYRVGILRRDGEVEIREPGIILIPPFTGRGVVIPLTEREADLLIELPGNAGKSIQGKYSYVIYDPQKYARHIAETIEGLINGMATATINMLVSQGKITGDQFETESIQAELDAQLQRFGDRFGVRIKKVTIFDHA